MVKMVFLISSPANWCWPCSPSQPWCLVQHSASHVPAGISYSSFPGRGLLLISQLLLNFLLVHSSILAASLWMAALPLSRANSLRFGILTRGGLCCFFEAIEEDPNRTSLRTKPSIVLFLTKLQTEYNWLIINLCWWFCSFV